MSDDQPAAPVEHIIPVECDIANMTLKVGLPTVGIKPEDRVLWQFSGLPSAEWTPWIEFQQDFLGPLTDLNRNGGAIWGKCSTQPPGNGPFVYRAVIQKGQGAAWEDAVATISSSAARLTLQSPGIMRRFEVTQNGTELSILPLGVELQANDTVEWVFNLPESIQPGRTIPDPWRPQVSFHRYDGSGQVANLSLGPFTNLTISSDRVIGTGNNGVNGVYFFRASRIQISDGSVVAVSSPDPAIDNRGGVGDPTGGGG
jgi:hypothetical protein